ncbi:MAG: aspartate kinase [Spirochaetales bacterium]|nr:aspartate kinase [Spirochaetales bacterium]
MRITALKFGGSSLADAAQFEKVASIIKSHVGKVFVVASAPGKRSKEDTKVTDMLYSCYDSASSGEDFKNALDAIRQRFQSIVDGLGLAFDLDSEFATIDRHLCSNPERDYMASRGEYLNSKILAAYLGYEFIDPAACIFFSQDGSLDAEKTNTELGQALSNIDNAVVAGFYGTAYDGKVKTFSRGGSDVTGAIVARAVRADVYENWTDVSGMLSADPRVVKDPEPIDEISYKELRELAYMGASVMHEDAVFPVRREGIPINIRNTNRPDDSGTWIVAHRTNLAENGKVVTGIAGKKGFSSIRVEKAMLNNEVGFAAKLLNIIASAGVSFEHVPSGIDTMSVIMDSEAFRQHRSQILENVQDELRPDATIVDTGIALIAIVGIGMVYRRGVAAKIFTALAQTDVNIRMIDQGSSEMNIIVGIDEADYEKAVNALYNAFFR